MINFYQDPKLTLFLDIEGVLIKTPLNNKQLNRVDEFMQKEFNKLDHTYSCKGCQKCVKGYVTLFNQEAVNHFSSLVEKIQKLAKVEIVISEEWKYQFGLEKVKDLFKDYSFHELILDEVLPKAKDFQEWHKCCKISSELRVIHYMDRMGGRHIDLIKYPSEIQNYADLKMIELNECPASQIKRWQSTFDKSNPFVILTSLDPMGLQESHLKQNFKENLISTFQGTKAIFTKEDSEKTFQKVSELLNLNC